MSPALWLVIGLAAVAVAAWAYATREERVPGRVGPAAIRALVVFLVIGGLALPSLRGGTLRAPSRVVLLDVSRSMSLPALTRSGAPSRLDSAKVELEALAPERVLVFGAVVRPVPMDSALYVRAEQDGSRLAPALEAAKLGGADSVWVLTDGDVDDRADALDLAASLGLGIREIRVSAPPPRIGIAAFLLPERVRSGDTVRATVELRSGGDPAGLPDSASVELRLDGEVVTAARMARPGPDRAVRAELTFVPTNPDDEPVWRRYEAVLTDPPDPFGVADRLPAWVEVSEATGGAVFVSTLPDWEARFLVPSLSRLVLGGARGFLRLGDGRYLEMAPSPRIVDEGRVRRAMRGSRLLVVRSAPDELPSWLESALRTHPRTLVFAAGVGVFPGSGARASGPLPGEWYPMAPLPPSPAGALLNESDLDSLPPAREVYALDHSGRWTILSANRSRRGEARPLLVAGERGDRRWAVATTSEWWRWALRDGAPRRIYDGALSGLVGWLVEESSLELAGLVARPAAGEPLVWRARRGASDLTVAVTDSAGAEVWRQAWAEPPPTVTGPALPPGRYEIRLTATGPEGPYESARPWEVAPNPAEMLARAPTTPAVLAAPPRVGPPIDVRAPRPVWPFALAILLLCGEWAWRHRIGLR